MQIISVKLTWTLKSRTGEELHSSLMALSLKGDGLLGLESLVAVLELVVTKCIKGTTKTALSMMERVLTYLKESTSMRRKMADLNAFFTVKMDQLRPI